MIKLYNDDCLNVLYELEPNSIDAVISDIPYGTTQCKWDSVIPFDKMWSGLERVTKPNSPIALFGTEPFSSYLRISNIKNFKYDWIWQKPNGTNPFQAKHQPMKKHEIISVFNTTIYYPQMEQGKPYKWNSTRTGGEHVGLSKGPSKAIDNKGTRYPSSIQSFKQDRGLHPTQKPVELIEYLIKTYSKLNDTILDFTMGSGTTGVACINTDRNFIGIELDIDYFDIARERIYE